MRERNPAKDSFMRAADFLFFPLAGVITFYLGPLIYRATKAHIAAYAASEFGNDWLWLFNALWVLGCAVGTFGLSLMVLALTLRLATAKIASLLFRR